MFQEREAQAEAGRGLAHSAVDPVEERDEGLDAGLGALELRLLVRDPDLMRSLARLREGREREEFAMAALRIGVLSLEQARGAVDARTVRSEVDRLLGDLGSALHGHRDALRLQTESVLKDYFDPKSGRFAERVERLTKDDGELAGVLRRHLASDDSMLSRTLAAHLGGESPIMRLVDPKNAEGLVAGVRGLLATELDAQREQILSQFSLDNEGGALKRLVGELTENHGRLSEALQKSIGDVARQFSLDEEGSALSRLVQRVESAQRTITSEFDLNEETSALARLRRELLAMSDRQNDAMANLDKKLSTELAAFAARRSAEQRSTTHGQEFQDLLLARIEQAAHALGDLFEDTSKTTGEIRNCKVGDAVITLGPEHQAAGARIVIEAKEEASYTLQRACGEIDEARRNRAASFGVFVSSRRTAPPGMPSFARYGNDAIVVWDADDAASDVFLEAALSLARALCVRAGATRHESVDLPALDRAIRDVEKQLEGLEEIRRFAETSESASRKILERVRILGQNLTRLVSALDVGATAVKRVLAE
jgi:hypothetical protein